MTEVHLPPEVISRVATGRLRNAERGHALSHLDECATCRDDATYLAGFRRKQLQRRLAMIGGTAVAALLVVAVCPVGIQGPGDGAAASMAPMGSAPPPPVSAVREGGEGVPHIASYAPDNGATVEGDSVLFVWQDMGPDTHYRLRVSSMSGAPVLDRPVRDTALYLALAPPLEAGTAYFWFVDGLLEEGGAARSSVWRFSILE